MWAAVSARVSGVQSLRCLRPLTWLNRCRHASGKWCENKHMSQLLQSPNSAAKHQQQHKKGCNLGMAKTREAGGLYSKSKPVSRKSLSANQK